MASDQSNTSRQAATTAKKARVPLDERRADVIEAALIEFGKGGYKGTSTLVFAEGAGIQQPYIYAIFKNKSELFLACHKALNERLLTVYREHAGDSDSPGERLANMRGAYRRLLEDDTWAQCQLQVLAAGGNSELRPPIRREFDRLFGQIVEISGPPRPRSPDSSPPPRWSAR
jgi:AcrR family transcriptional regulator